jgi:RNA 2',3'-cyclic 3'-phosphodiesterase
MTETWRCFVAVPLNEQVQAALSATVTAWRQEAPVQAMRWAEPDGWHVTLAFLGDVDPSDIAAVSETLRGVAGAHQPTEVGTGRLGAFPRSSSARVLWYGVADPDGALARLAGALAAALRVPSEEPFRPHVTLARARRRAVDLRGWIERASESAPAGRMAVESINLMRSHLGGGPAEYEALATVPLRGER